MVSYVIFRNKCLFSEQGSFYLLLGPLDNTKHSGNPTLAHALGVIRKVEVTLLEYYFLECDLQTSVSLGSSNDWSTKR